MHGSLLARHCQVCGNAGRLPAIRGLPAAAYLSFQPAVLAPQPKVYAKPVEVLTRDRLLGAYEVGPKHVTTSCGFPHVNLHLLPVFGVLYQ
jgi:hypothetical protein